MPVADPEPAGAYGAIRTMTISSFTAQVIAGTRR